MQLKESARRAIQRVSSHITFKERQTAPLPSEPLIDALGDRNGENVTDEQIHLFFSIAYARSRTNLNEALRKIPRFRRKTVRQYREINYLIDNVERNALARDYKTNPSGIICARMRMGTEWEHARERFTAAQIANDPDLEKYRRNYTAATNALTMIDQYKIDSGDYTPIY